MWNFMSMSVSVWVSVQYECDCGCVWAFVCVCENSQWKVCVCADSRNVWKLRIAAAAKDGQEIPQHHPRTLKLLDHVHERVVLFVCALLTWQDEWFTWIDQLANVCCHGLKLAPNYPVLLQANCIYVRWQSEATDICICCLWQMAIISTVKAIFLVWQCWTWSHRKSSFRACSLHSLLFQQVKRGYLTLYKWTCRKTSIRVSHSPIISGTYTHLLTTAAVPLRYCTELVMKWMGTMDF